jgi:hypothetical protein
MKINLPKKHIESEVVGKSASNNSVNKETTEKTTTGWRVKPGQPNFITAIINGKLITIDIKTFEIIMNHNFRIKCKSVEDAKSKALDFFK